jgi:predicted nucleic acid-binding protein
LIVLDTSTLVTYMDRGEADHEAVATWMDANEEPLVTTPLAVAEMDYLVTRFGGGAGAHALRRSLASAAFEVMWWEEALAAVLTVADAQPQIGLTDASLVALAARLRTTRIATLDERRFRTARPLTGEPAFTILPADAH